MDTYTHLSKQDITHVIHIADIHVRVGNYTTARVEEYTHVFNNFLEEITNLACVKENKALLVIAGDIFHSKCRMESASTKVFFEWINNLLSLVPIVVICGNHDFKQSEPDITDSVDMLATPYQGKTGNQLHYLKDTGRYVWGNIGFGLVSVKETLRAFNTAGVVQDLPDFPAPGEFPATCSYKVALFHGTISQSALPSGRNADTVSHGYPLQWFDGYDAVMLGDNHMQQINKTASGMIWAYPGSLIQQDFGEPLMGHGYILWEVATHTCVAKHVPNNYGSITVIDDSVYIAPHAKFSYKDAIQIASFPKHPRVRVVGDASDAELCEKILKKYDIKPSCIVTRIKGAINKTFELTNDDNALDDKLHQLVNLNSPEYWEKYMKSQEDPIDVSEWIHNADKMLLPNTYNLSTSLTDSITTRNNKLQTYLDVYDANVRGIVANTHKTVLKYMQWDYLMCFGENNYFDFELVENKIALINGANATGKSSFLDVLCIAIYGEPTSCRRDFSGTNTNAKIINDSKPLQAQSGVSLTVTIDNVDYEIQRTFIHHNQDEDNIKPVVTAVYKLENTMVDGETELTKVVVAEGGTMVDSWVHKHFGSAEEMLMSTILCQNDTTNFFYKKSTEQRHILEKALHMDTISTYVAVLDESIKAHKYIIDKINSYRQGMTESSTSQSGVEVNVDMIQELQTTYDTCKETHEQLQRESDRLLSSIGDIQSVTQLATQITDEPEDLLVESQRLLMTLPKYSIDEQEEVISKSIKIDIDMQRLEEEKQHLGNAHCEAAQGTTESLLQLKEKYDCHLKAKPANMPKFSLQHINNVNQDYNDWVKNQDSKWLKTPKKIESKIAQLMDETKTCEASLASLKTHNISQPTHSVDAAYLKQSRNNKTTLEELFKYYTEATSELELHQRERPSLQETNHTSEVYENVIREYNEWYTKQNQSWMEDIDSVKKNLDYKKAELHALESIISIHLVECAIRKPNVERLVDTEPEPCDDDDVEATEELLESLQDVIVPCRPSSEVEKWNKTHADWESFVRTVPGSTVDELCARSAQLKKYIEEVHTVQTDLHDALTNRNNLTSELDEIKGIEFNPECWACCKQPKVLRMKHIETELVQLSKTIITLEKKVKKTSKSYKQSLDEQAQIDVQLPIRKQYEDKLPWMQDEIAAWTKAKNDMELESQRKQRLSVVWWQLWDDWNCVLDILKSKRRSFHENVGNMEDFVNVAVHNINAYNEAVANLEHAKKYHIWSVDNSLLQTNVNDIHHALWTKWNNEIERLHAKIEANHCTINTMQTFRDEHNKWKTTLVDIEKESQLLEQLDKWFVDEEALKQSVKCEEWKIRSISLYSEMECVKSHKQHIEHLKTVEKNISNHKSIILLREWKTITNEKTQVSNTLQTLNITLSKAKDNYEQQQKCESNIKSVNYALDDLKKRLDNLSDFQRRFVGDKKVDGFKMWVYKTIVIPMIEREVNNFIQNIDEFTMKIRIRNGHFIFMLNDRGSNPTLDHASGYQKFIVGLGMRIALSRIGAIGQNMKHLFIDEGFVACDSNNILKTKEVMDLLMSIGGYNSILLISHLEAIKDIAQTRIDVKRPDDAKTSYIRLGMRKKPIKKLRLDKNNIPVERKKPGRPSKAALAAARLNV